MTWLLNRSWLVALGDQLRSETYSRAAEAAGKRDLRLDLLRGFCVFVMIADHIGGNGSWLYLVTGGDQFFVSAAEGFVLISGVTFGIVYRDVILRRGILTMLKKSFERAGLLYLLTVTLTLLFAAISYLLQAPWSRTVTAAPPLAFVVGVVTLHRSHPLTDVLFLYTFLIFAAPALLGLLASGRTRLLLLAVWGLWAAWQVAPDLVDAPWPVVDGGFPLPAWQVLFSTGLVVGYHRRAIAEWLRGRRGVVLFVASVAVCVAAVTLYGQTPLATSDLFEKNDLRLGRVLALAAVASFAYGLVTIFWQPVRRAAGWLLMPLGQNALSAYSLHLFVLALAGSAIADPLRDLAGNTLTQIAGIALVWLALPGVQWLSGVNLRGRSTPLYSSALRLVRQQPAA